MLRSFAYAAGAVIRADAERATPAADQAVARWLAESRHRFVHAYEDAVARAGVPLAMDTLLLRAFEVEKACYEIRYEASNRPDWVRLPMAGLRSLLDA